MHSPNRYIYIVACELYNELSSRLNLSSTEKCKEKILSIMIRKGIYDLCAPEYIEIENHDGYVIWKSCCVYNDWFTDDELPEFKFEIQQYKDALEQLKSLINDR